jgi:RNA polymerase sigma-70 factor (ECF subfamily)
MPHCYEVEVDGLVEALRERDEAAYRSLVTDWTPLMIRVARSHVSTDASADEVVQDTWVAVLRGIDSFEGRSSLRTWTFRILTNIARTRGVRERRAVPNSSLGPTVDPGRFRGPDDQYPGGWKMFPIEWPSPEEAAVEAERTEIVAAAIARLPARQQLVISLRDVHGFPSGEVCELLGLTQANQRVLLHRARAAVRAEIAATYEGGVDDD